MRALVVSLAFFGLAMAGCTEPAPETDGSALDDVPALLVPQWSIGDWWTYDFGGGFEVTWVVTGDDGSDWLMNVDNAQFQFHHQAFDEVSTLGSVSKANLAGSQEDGRVKLLDFPLLQGKTWPMQWDHESYDAEVVDATATTARIEYSQNGVVERIIEFDADFGWLKKLIYIGDDGSPGVVAQGKRSGSNYAGEYYQFDIHKPYSEQRGGFGSAGQNVFDVPDDSTAVYYSIEASCNPDGLEGDGGAYGYRVHGPDPEEPAPFEETWNCPAGGQFVGMWPAPTPGEWTAQGFYAGGSIDATFVPHTEHRLTVSQ